VAEATSTTNFSVERVPFNLEAIDTWGETDSRHRNWPIVYILNNETDVYVGESLNAVGRMHQHLDSTEKQHLKTVRVILDDTFNKSACLDLESYLIRMFSGDGSLTVLNRNAGITNAEYFNRDSYQALFEDIFEQLRTKESLFQRTIPEIINSDLFKLSPFKALNHDQAIAVEDILEGLFSDLYTDTDSTIVIEGNPGTGKTVVAIYLLKLLKDIEHHNPEEVVDTESIFNDFFTPGHTEILRDIKIGFVIPQQALRKSVEKVFEKTPGLSKEQVLSAFDVGSSKTPYDILIVDEAHRLGQRANQSSGGQNKKFSEINMALFGEDNLNITQLDWVRKQSKNTILMLDTRQTVRPADLPLAITKELASTAHATGRHYRLQSQMRIAADQDYIGYIRSVLSDSPPPVKENFSGYDLRFFTDFSMMREQIRLRENEHGLSRLVAGYAWKWQSKNNKEAFDIELDGEHLRWNSTQEDWISSPNSPEEVGSIHTVQGYDLNYAGVIIGQDLRYDTVNERIIFDRAHYYDTKGRENNRKLGIKYTDDDILQFVTNIYVVLLTRGIRGTYIYVVDEPLRNYLAKYF